MVVACLVLSTCLAQELAAAMVAPTVVAVDSWALSICLAQEPAAAMVASTVVAVAYLAP